MIREEFIGPENESQSIIKIRPFAYRQEAGHYISQSQVIVCAYENYSVPSRRYRVMKGGTALWNRDLNIV